MTTALIVGVLAVAWLVAVVRLQPHEPSPVASVDHQHRALEAIHEAAERARSDPARGSSGQPPATGRHRRSPARIHDGATLLPAAPLPPSLAGAAVPGAPAGGARGGRRPGFRRPLTAAVLAAALAGAGAAVNTVATRTPGPGDAAPESADPGPAGAARASRDGSPLGTAARPASPAPGSATATTPTTAVRAAARVVSSGSRAAEVIVGGGAYRLSVAANGGRCWIQVAAASGGGPAGGTILEAGRTATFELTGPAAVHLGNAAAVSFAVDGDPVALPTLPAGAYRLDLRPET